MENEHCKCEDSTISFRASNYGTETMSVIEYWFVAEPTDEKLEELTDQLADVSIKVTDVSALTWPTENPKTVKELPGFKPREKKLDLTNLPEAQEINSRLHDENMAPLMIEELVGARLYTGPMYLKYNSVLRNIGKLRLETDDASTLTGDELVLELKKMERKMTTQARNAATQGNLYITTLHVINSAVIKLGKLTRATKVYRGISKRTLPAELQRPNADNVRGGVEFGFTSCSLERDEALKYARSASSDGAAVTTPILMEMEMGMIDRGADLTWLSQYPEEKEILFPPLTGLEFINHSIDSDLLIVAIRPSVNLQSLTIEQVVAKMQKSHTQLLHLLTDSLRFASVPAKALEPLVTLKMEAEHREPEWFNATRNYREATIRALDKQVDVFKTLVAATEGEDYCKQMSRSQLWNIALITARSGEHQLAVKLLLRFIEAPHEVGGDPVEIKGDPHLQVAKVILADGLQSPWPATLATLASRERWEPKYVTDLIEALTDHVVNAGDPFRVGAKVLMQVGHGAERSSTLPISWETATVKRTRTSNRSTFDLVNWKTHMNIDASKVIAPSSSGLSSAMREAARIGDSNIVKCMLKAKVDTFNCDEQGNTVLIVASEYGHANVCKLLMDARTDGRDTRNLKAVRNRKRQNAYDIAVSKKHQAVVRIIEPNSTVKLCKPEDVKAFHDKYFVTDQEVNSSVTDEIFGKFANEGKIGERALEKALRELGLDPSDKMFIRYDTDGNGLLDKNEFLLLAKDVFAEQGMMWRRNDTPIVAEDYTNGITSLMLACKHGALEAVKELLQVATPPDINQMTSELGISALAMAAAYGNPDIVKLLLIDHKADPNAACADKNVTPIFYAAQSGFEVIVEELIKAGADVNAARKKEGTVEKDGRRPLMVAAQHGYWKSTKILIEKKADVNATNHKGESALMFACRYGQTKTASLLLKEGLNVQAETEKQQWTSLHRACANGHHATAEVLLNSCPELLHHADDKGMTPLMAACQSGQSKIASALIRRGAAVDLKNGSGETALWIAAKGGMSDAIKVLTHSKEGRESKLVNQKLRHNGQMMTPVMIAANYGHDFAVRALIKVKADLKHSNKDEMDVLMLAVQAGHKQLVQLIFDHAATTRMRDAMGLAIEKKDLEMVGILTIKEKQKDKSKWVLTRAGTSMASLPEGNSKGSERLEPEKINADFDALSDFKKQFDGMLVPARPTEKQIKDHSTVTGTIMEHGGVVLQKGPFGGVFMRAGCIPRTPWHRLWETLKQYTDHFVKQEKKRLKKNDDVRAAGGKDKPYVCKGIYICVSQGSMQAIDFKWLSRQGFRFHHYRKAGHGTFPDHPSSPALDRSGSAHGSTKPADEEHDNAEFVYYCWPGKPEHDRVPSYATSIEGATGMALSKDETRVLLVWERGSWSTPGGAVEPGENKLDALERELREEVNLTLDLVGWGAQYLGGWQQSKARDNLVNDNFSSFLVKVANDSYQADESEITHAGWFDWRHMLNAWRAAGKPTKDGDGKELKYFEMNVGRPEPPSDKKADNMNRVRLNVLEWLDQWQNGRTIKCEYIPGPPQAGEPASKVKIG